MRNSFLTRSLIIPVDSGQWSATGARRLTATPEPEHVPLAGGDGCSHVSGTAGADRRDIPTLSRVAKSIINPPRRIMTSGSRRSPHAMADAGDALRLDRDGHAGPVIGCANVRVWEVRPEATAQAVRDVLGERPFGEPDSPSIGLTGPQPPPDRAHCSSRPTCVSTMRLGSGSVSGCGGPAIRRVMALAYEAMSSPVGGGGAGIRGPLPTDACSLYNRCFRGSCGSRGDTSSGRTHRGAPSWSGGASG